MALRVERYGNTRYWALYDGHELVAVVVYRKGAAELLQRLQAQEPGAPAAPAPAGAATAARWRGSPARRREPHRDQRERPRRWRRPQPPRKPPSREVGGWFSLPWPCPPPARFSGQAAAIDQRQGECCQGRVSAERSEGSLDSRSPPCRYTLMPPGRAGVLALREPPGGRTGRRRRAQPSGSRPRLEREPGDSAGVGGGPQTDARHRAQGAEAAWFVRLKPEHEAGRTARSAARWPECEGAEPS